MTNADPWILHRDSSKVPSGNAELEVTAIDAAGLTGTSLAKKLAVTVQPPPPSATEAPSATAIAIVTPVATVVPPPPQSLPIWRSPFLLAFVVGLVGLLVIVAASAYPRLRRAPAEEQFVGSPTTLLLPPDSGALTMTFASLTVLQGPGLVDHVFLIAERAVIGRDPTYEVFIDDWTKSVSRQHAEIRRQEFGFMLYDLGSLNGTRVGTVVAKPDEGILLTDDAKIALGNRYVLKFTSAPDADDRTTRPIDVKPRPRHERRKDRERWEASRAPRR
jgi:hypothetical protein